MNAAESLSRADLPPAKRREYQDLLRGGLERIQATVGRLLRLAPRQARPQALALVDPVLDAIGLVAHRADALRVAIELSCDGRAEDAVARARRLPSLSGEPNELAQAVLNLLVNALDALEGLPPGTGRIRVDLAAERGELVLAVADNGPGVAAESLPRISDAFYTTKEVGKGTGLGLAIVQNVVASHGGRVELFSRKDDGFRAVIHLPLGGATTGERKS